MKRIFALILSLLLCLALSITALGASTPVVTYSDGSSQLAYTDE